MNNLIFSCSKFSLKSRDYKYNKCERNFEEKTKNLLGNNTNTRRWWRKRIVKSIRMIFQHDSQNRKRSEVLFAGVIDFRVAKTDSLDTQMASNRRQKPESSSDWWCIGANRITLDKFEFFTSHALSEPPPIVREGSSNKFLSGRFFRYENETWRMISKD